MPSFTLSPDPHPHPPTYPSQGPFSADVLIQGNAFSLAEGRMMHSQTQGEGLVQLGGCRPIGQCAPAPPGDTLGPALTGEAS